MLDVMRAACGQQVGQLGRVAVRVDQRHGFGETFERLFPLAFRSVGGGEVPQQRGALGPLRLLRESGCEVTGLTEGAVLEMGDA